MTYLRDSILILEVISFALMLYYGLVRKLSYSEKIFLFILFITVLVESTGMVLRKIFSITNNISLYNVYIVSWFSLLFYLYYTLIKSKNMKLCTMYFWIFYLFSSIVLWLSVENFFRQLQGYGYIIGSLLLITIIMFFLVEKLRSNEVMVFTRELFIWISVGILIYSVGKIPFRVISNVFENTQGTHPIFSIRYVLPIPLYLCFIVGIIWGGIMKRSS